MKLSDAFSTSFEEVLQPVLVDLGFVEVKLKDCMRPEYLFRNGRIWFSLSWDCRDQYFDASLGHLFWFRDVMPRVVVIGDFHHWDRTVRWNSIRSEADIQKIFAGIKEALPRAVDQLEIEYPRIFEDFRASRSGAPDINIAEYIGEEVQLGALEKYQA
jgi:hypothetical protein